MTKLEIKNAVKNARKNELKLWRKLEKTEFMGSQYQEIAKLLIVAIREVETLKLQDKL